MRLSDRAAAHGSRNEIARVREELAGMGAAVTDLSDTNPTVHGLLHPGVLDAVRRHIHDASRYTPLPHGPIEARESLAARYGGSPDDYWLTSSTSQAYSWLLTILADPGQAVATPTPGYPLTQPLARFAGVRTVDYRSDYVHPDGWLLEPASLDAALADPNVRAAVAVNPGNPTGAYTDRDTIMAACARHQKALIADEVFLPFTLDCAGDGTDNPARHDAPARNLADAARTLATGAPVPTFALGGLSKLLCAPQLKLGWIRLSGPPAELPGIRDALDTIADTFLPVSAPVAAALPDLLGLADESVATTCTRLRTNLATVRELLADGPFRVRRCDGGWMVLIDMPTHLPCDDLALHLLRHAGLAAHPGWFYDIGDAGVLVLSLLPEPHAFASGVRRLRQAIERLVAGEMPRQ